MITNISIGLSIVKLAIFSALEALYYKCGEIYRELEESVEEHNRYFED